MHRPAALRALVTALIAPTLAVPGLALTASRGGAAPAGVAPVVRLHLAHARPGAAPRVLLMEGRTINRPHAAAVRVPLPPLSGIYWSLVGRQPHGYLLVNYDIHLHLDLYGLEHGRRTLLARTGATPEYADVLAGDGGRRTAFWSQNDTAERSVGKVYDTHGRLVTHVRTDGSSRMLAFDGRRAVISGTTTSVWTLGSAPVPLVAEHAYLASLRHDLLFVRTADGTIGPTSLSAPGAPAWTAAFKPTGLSRDGRLVVGDVTGQSDHVQVRRVGDGHVVADLAVPGHANYEPLLLEDRRHLLVQATVHHRGVSLFRCTFSGPAVGHCVRTWPWNSASIFAGWHFSGPGIGTGFRA